MRWSPVFIAMWIGIATNAAALAERRALVIGIATYQSQEVPRLVNSSVDADLVGKKLESVGFHVDILKGDQVTAEKFALFWQNFKEHINSNDEIVFYFSGHGLSKDGSNYIALHDVSLPKDNTSFAKLRPKLYNVSDISRELQELEVQIGVIILEACRENLFGPSTHAFVASEGGLTVRKENRGTVVWYAASSGEVAKDSDSATSAPHGSTFTRVMVENFDKFKTADIERFAKEIREPVYAAAQPIAQHSEMESNIFFDWCFEKCADNPKQTRVNVYSADKASSFTATRVSFTKYNEFLETEKIESNAIFLGKKSWADRCQGKVGDGFPFGCDILNKLIVAEKTNSLPSLPELKFPLTTVTETHVRIKLPIINKDGNGVYGCVVKTLPQNSQVMFARVVSMAYDGDVFYWGVTADKLGSHCAS